MAKGVCGKHMLMMSVEKLDLNREDFRSYLSPSSMRRISFLFRSDSTDSTHLKVLPPNRMRSSSPDLDLSKKIGVEWGCMISHHKMHSRDGMVGGVVMLVTAGGREDQVRRGQGP